MKITQDGIKAAEKVLADNGIEEDEVKTVLQAVGYALADVELYPEPRTDPDPDFDFAEAFMKGVAEACGAFVKDGRGGRIEAGGRSLQIECSETAGRFRFSAGEPADPDMAFECRPEGWEEWMAVDAGRDFGYQVASIVFRGK